MSATLEEQITAVRALFARTESRLALTEAGHVNDAIVTLIKLGRLRARILDIKKDEEVPLESADDMADEILKILHLPPP